MRQDSSRSKDADGSLDNVTPRSSDVRRRPNRIDLGIRHSPRPPSRVTAARSGAADSRSSAADSGSVPRPIQPGSLARRAVVAAAVQETTTPNIDERPRHSSGDVTRRVGWSRDASVTRDRDRQRQTTDSVDSQPLRGSDDNADSRPTKPASPSQCPTTRTVPTAGLSSRARTATLQRQVTSAEQRRPAATTTVRPSTTPKSGRTAGGLTMTKSVSQPSFLAMLVSGTAVSGRGAGARGHVTAKTPNTERADNDAQCTETNDNGDDNNNNNNNENDDDDDDEDDEMKRQMIEDWLQHLDTVVLDRPPSPIIDEDVPPQTDTAIHIVYDGD